MFGKTILIVIIVLAMVTMACGISVNIPEDRITIGPLETETINIPVPIGDTIGLELNFGAGKLALAPGAVGTLLEGTATYNVPDFKPEISLEGSKVTLSTGNLKIEGFPGFDSDRIENTWDLKLGNVPLNLTINSGAYEGNIELGGLKLLNLEIKDGAADVDVKFSAPNQADMNTLRYTTGASNVSLTGLANANFQSMVFRSGAGSYTLDFSGDLNRNVNVVVESGVSEVKIIVPDSFQVRLNFTGGLSDVTPSGAWQKTGNVYSIDGIGPVLNIDVKMGAGSLDLRTTP